MQVIRFLFYVAIAEVFSENDAKKDKELKGKNSYLESFRKNWTF